MALGKQLLELPRLVNAGMWGLITYMPVDLIASIGDHLLCLRGLQAAGYILNWLRNIICGGVRIVHIAYQGCFIITTSLLVNVASFISTTVIPYGPLIQAAVLVFILGYYHYYQRSNYPFLGYLICGAYSYSYNHGIFTFDDWGWSSSEPTVSCRLSKTGYRIR